jgi:hypothetical protein
MEPERSAKISFPVVGELIWISLAFPIGLTDEQFRRLDRCERDGARWLRSMRPAPAVAHADGEESDDDCIR